MVALLWGRSAGHSANGHLTELVSSLPGRRRRACSSAPRRLASTGPHPPSIRPERAFTARPPGRRIVKRSSMPSFVSRKMRPMASPRPSRAVWIGPMTNATDLSLSERRVSIVSRRARAASSRSRRARQTARMRGPSTGSFRDSRNEPGASFCTAAESSAALAASSRATPARVLAADVRTGRGGKCHEHCAHHRYPRCPHAVSGHEEGNR